MCFTMCLCISPDLDGFKALNENVSRYVCWYVCFTVCFTICFTVCLVSRYVFTICLFISPDLDGHRAPKNGFGMFHDMFVH
jgi:hypothetical protein